MAHGNNSGGGDAVGLGPVRDMALFDELPAPLRRALAEANSDYSVYQVHYNVVNKLYSLEHIEKALRGEL